MVTLSKSLSGYGLPFSCLLIKRSLDMWKPAEHNGTFRGNCHAFVTATASIEQYWSTDDFANEIAAKGEHLRARLQAMVERFAGDVVEVKGRGMMIGVRCADPKRAASVTAKAYQNGLIIERAGPEDEVIKCMMPLTTTFAELDEAMDILEAAMAEEFGVARPRSPSVAVRLAGEPRGGVGRVGGPPLRQAERLRAICPRGCLREIGLAAPTRGA
jgi:diaminobutyrate-2-oxoglutarate transaminase